MITVQQINAIRDEADWWTSEASNDLGLGNDDAYARGQAAGLRRALRMLGADDT